tara:strand:+ start:184 stop:417 length:234 start_codon:yes stop_codon:yes gene_type:complete
MKPMKPKKRNYNIGLERIATYNNWMQYIYDTLYKKPSENKSKIGNRSISEIQKEIQELREIDKLISDKVRASYTIKK